MPEKMALIILFFLSFSTAMMTACARKANSAKGVPTARAHRGKLEIPTKSAGELPTLILDVNNLNSHAQWIVCT